MHSRALIVDAGAAYGLQMLPDLPVRPPAPAPMYAPPPPFSWTGFYIGGNLGAGWNHGNVSDSNNFFNLGVDNSTTFVGGGQVGGNYHQFNNLRCWCVRSGLRLVR